MEGWTTMRESYPINLNETNQKSRQKASQWVVGHILNGDHKAKMETLVKTQRFRSQIGFASRDYCINPDEVENDK